MKSDNQFLFTAPVMIPNKPDCDYERGETPFTVDEIRFFKNSFDDYQIIDKEHQVFKDIGSAKSIGNPVDSFILAENTTYELADGSHETYPSGTWMLTANVTDPLAQQEILDGELTGWSPSVNTVEIATLIKEAMAMKSSAGQLIHDIEDPATVTVSIVKKPCQTGSKQCKLKNNNKKLGDEMSEDSKTLTRVREALGMGEPAATKSDFDALAEKIKEENEAAMKSLADEMGTIIADSVKEALAPLGALKADKPEDEDETEDETEEKTEEETSSEDQKTNETEDEDEEKKKGSTKSQGQSKTPPVHDGGSTKSEDDVDVYTFLGRNADGTKKIR